MTTAINKKFFYALFLSLLAGLAQSSGLISIAGIKPNLVLIILVASLFWGVNFWEGLLVYIFGFISLVWQPTIGLELLSLSIVSLLLVSIISFVSFNKVINSMILMGLAVLLFYSIHAYSFLLNSSSLVFFEIFINSIIFLAIIWIERFLESI